MVLDVLQLLFGQTRVAEQVRPLRVRKRALQECSGLPADNVDGVAEFVVSNALDDLHGAFGVLSVDEEVCAEFEEFGAVAGDVGDADDAEAGEFGKLESDEARCGGGCDY